MAVCEAPGGITGRLKLVQRLEKIYKIDVKRYNKQNPKKVCQQR